jgi:transcriptional regulator with XRE-family HTH domain/tetratricopeptide (TPR) repeat protein
MGQKPKQLTPTRSPVHRWGYELRALRTAQGVSLRELAEKVLIDHSHLGRFERGERLAVRQQAHRLDAALGASGSLARLWDDTIGRPSHVANSPDDVANASPTVAPGSSDQAGSDEGIFVPCRLDDGRVVFVSLDRRALLRGGFGLGAAATLGSAAPAAADPPAVSRAVRRAWAAWAAGSTPVEHLRKVRRLLIDSDNLMGPRQVLESARAHIDVIKVLRRDARGSDSRDLLELQTQYAEFASWLHQDLGDYRTAQFWLDRAFQWSHTVGDTDLTSYVMARKAQLAGDMRDVVDVVDLAEAAQRTARPGSRLAAVARTYEAYGHALRGDASESSRAIDQVRDVLDAVSQDPSPWGVWLNEPYVEVHRAQGLEVLGQHDRAAEAFATAIRSLPDGYHRDRGVYLAREAVAHAGGGNPEQAAGVGLQALAVAEDTGSGRIVSELARLDTVLARWKDLPEVAEFRSTFDAALLHETEMDH